MPNYSGASSVQPVSAGYAAPWQTAKAYTGYQALAATASSFAIETVTTGKTFYITDIVISTDVASGTNTDIQIQAGGTPVFRGSTHSLAPIEAMGLETQPFASSAQAVTLNVAAAATTNHVWFYIAGFEQ
jgi:hypothetical protein